MFYGRRILSSHAKITFLAFLIASIFILSLIMTNYKLSVSHRGKNFCGVSQDYEKSLLKKQILEETRKEIRSQLQKYNLTGAEDLDDLILEKHGTPLRTMIVSSWRSGSTFLGDLFNAQPANFYHYEPMYNYSIVQIKGPPLADNAFKTVRNLLKCSYEDMEHYFEINRKKMYLLNYNTRLWKYCKDDVELCFDTDFLERFCKLFPYQSMKVVRFRLRLVREIMRGENSNIKTILLVRDPRAIMLSRRHSNKNFCLRGADCFLPEYLCADMISDYKAAGQLMREFPGRFIAIRFEELASNPRYVAKRLFEFSGRRWSSAIEEFLRTHTSSDPNVGETYRNTKTVPFRWKDVLEFDHVNDIQVLCKQAMDLWGYQMAHNETHMKSEQFYPLKAYSVKEP